MKRNWPALGFLMLTGCVSLPHWWDAEPTTQVTNHPLVDQQAKVVQRAKIDGRKASPEIAQRVDKAGQKLVDSNPQLGRPLFATIGAPEPEIFHVNADMLYITEGLVKMCPTEVELSAVLATELGKMVSEREAKVPQDLREPEPLPPISLPIGSNGYSPANDPSHMIEMAKFEKRYPKKRPQITRPDPRKVAESVLEQAGFRAADLNLVQPILHAADRNCALEQQLKGVPPATNWQR
jgi:hypothetical protein